MDGPIPNYDLYAERRPARRADDPVHCEPLSLRAGRHGWRIENHRHHRLDQVFCIIRGGGIALIDGIAYSFGPRSVVVVPRLAAHGFRFERGSEGWAITVADGLGIALAAEPLVAELTTLQPIAELIALAEAMFHEHRHDEPMREEALWHLAGLLGVWLRRNMAPDQPRRDGAQTRLVARFRALVDRHFTEHWSVARYAEALAVTPAHLSRVCRQVTGKPASETIFERIMLEARRELGHTDRRVSEIAQDLGYDNVAYFSRFFGARAGLSPTRFRAEARRVAD